MKQTKPTIRDFRSALSDGFFTRLKEKSTFIFWEEECRSDESTCPLLRELIRMKVIFIPRQGKQNLKKSVTFLTYMRAFTAAI